MSASERVDERPPSAGSAADGVPGEGGARSLLERARLTPSIRPVAGASGLRAAIAVHRASRAVSSSTSSSGAVTAAGALSAGTVAASSSPSSSGVLAAAGASVERVTIEVRIGSRTEMVALGLDGGRLLVAASDGGGEGSPFVQAALAWLDPGLEGPVETDLARPSVVGASGASEEAHTSTQDLLLAVARGGVSAGAGPAVTEALGRISAQPRGAVPLVRSRWLARVAAALLAGDADLVARLLVTGVPPAASRALEMAVDRTYVELAREPVAGDAGTTIERRYLFDVVRSEILLEERALGESGASLGPCPRVCAVGYGEIHDGTPRRIVVSQYAVAPEVPAGEWERVLGGAVPLAAATRSALEILAVRGDAEPAALVLGAQLEGSSVLDDAGVPYPFAPGPAATAARAALVELARKGPLRWVLGRFELAAGEVGLVPLACAWRDGDRWWHARLR